MDLDKVQKLNDKPFLKKFEGITKYINFGLIILIIGLIVYYIYKNNLNNSSTHATNKCIKPSLEKTSLSSFDKSSFTPRTKALRNLELSLN